MTNINKYSHFQFIVVCLFVMLIGWPFAAHVMDLSKPVSLPKTQTHSFARGFGEEKRGATKFEQQNNHSITINIQNIMGPANEYTILAWFSTNKLNRYHEIISFSSLPSRNDTTTALRLFNGYLEGIIYDTNGSNTLLQSQSFTIQVGTWHYVAFMLNLNMNTATVYLDDLEHAKIHSRSNILVGDFLHIAPSFSGKMACIQLFSSILDRWQTAHSKYTCLHDTAGLYMVILIHLYGTMNRNNE